MDFLGSMEEANKKEQQPKWTGTFREFLELYERERDTQKNMGVLSHQRIYNMILDAGVEEVTHFGRKRRRYKFFEDYLYGVEESLDSLMSYIHSAAQRTETSRRMLLMYGPPSSGKSEIVNLIKRGLEKYSRTVAGTTYAVAGSKMHENPFLLIPEHMREEMESHYNVPITGYLSPATQYRLRHEFSGSFLEFPIEQIFFSEAERIGIGTWLPSDTKCITADCLLFTSSGLVRGKDVFVDKVEVSPLGSDNQFTALEQVFDNGIQPVYNIKMRGMSLEATANHRFMTVNSDGMFEWTPVGDIQSKVLPLKLGTALFGEDSLLQQLDESLYSERHHKVTCPERINPDLSRLAGYLISEGYCDDRQISFSNQNNDLNNDFRSIVEKEFEVYSMTYKRDVRRAVEDEDTSLVSRGVVISKQKFVDFININFETNTGACDKRIPRCILASSRDSQIQFLEGLYLGDGTVYCRGTTAGIAFSSCSETLITDVQMMLFNFGFYGCVSSYVDKKHTANTQYRLTVEGWDALKLGKMLPAFTANRAVDWSSAAKQDEHCYESFGDLHGLINKIRESTKGTRDIIDRRYTTCTENGRSPSRMSLQKWLIHLESDDCVWDKPENKNRICRTISNILKHRCVPVVSVEYAGHKPVYDIEVSNKDHSFIVNGLISHNSQDLSELVGGIDFAKIKDVGDESDPRAYNFDGELLVSNRGLCEFIEGLKADEKFLRSNLTATQEKAVKAPRFGMISVDNFIVMHSNETEFRNFMNENKYEAYHDRMVMIPQKHNLGVKNEVKIHKKLLQHSDAIKEMHIAPHTLEAAAMFAVLTRIEPDDEDGINAVNKMKLYDAQHVKGYKIEQVPDIRKKSPYEGMSGVSSRFISDQISAALSKSKVEGRDFITALDILRQLDLAVTNRDTFKADEKNRYKEFIDITKTEWHDLLRDDIQKAFFVEYEQDAKNLFENYLDHIEAYCADRKPRDQITGDEIELDEKLMESIEGHIGVSHSGCKDFRNEILRYVAIALRKKKSFNYIEHAELTKAIRKQLFEERQGAIRMTVSVRNPDPEQLRRYSDVIKRMTDKQGYSEASANELCKYASSHLFDK